MTDQRDLTKVEQVVLRYIEQRPGEMNAEEVASSYNHDPLVYAAIAALEWELLLIKRDPRTGRLRPQ